MFVLLCKQYIAIFYFKSSDETPEKEFLPLRIYRYTIRNEIDKKN